MNSRKCTRCGQVKDADQFYRRSDRNVPMSACKPCTKARAVAWAKTHPEKRRDILRRSGAKRRRKPEGSAQVLVPQDDRKEEQ